MNPALLLDYFDRISEAPAAIPRLRQFILDLAARGRLVEQDPGDEPASELLRRIQAEKARLVVRGEIRKQEVLPLNKNEEPFPIPVNWVWTRLGQIGDWGSGSTPLRGNHDFFGGGITWLKSGELNDNKQLAGSEETVTEAAVSKGSFRRNRAGDVLIAMYGATIGKVAILAEPAVTNQAVCGCSPFSGVFNLYLFNFLLSQRAQFHAASEGGAQPNISKIKILGFAFPLPPLAEQRRIVAKVDELMALCDRLEAVQHEREGRRDILAAASHHHLNNGANTYAFRKHADFYINHLQIISVRPDQVLPLRSTLLSLAIRGHLAQQDPNDEPAVELLKYIQGEKDQLIRDGKIKKEKPIPGVAKEEEPFCAPVGWKWVRLDSLTQLITKGSSPKWQGIEYVSAGDGILFVTSENVGNYRLRKMDEPKYVENKFNEIEPRSILRHGDILMNLVGASIGRTAVYDLDDGANINQAVALIRLVENDSTLFTEYLLHYFNSPLAIDLMLASRVTTAQPNISLTDARQFLIPIPPRAEQNRIVVKVNELMAVCDQLEAQLTATQAEAGRLLEAVLHQSLSEAS